MAAPSLTYTLTNGSTADATQVMQNFNDLLNGITDGTKDLSISALTCAGTATLNGHVNLGNSSADDITVTGSLASTLPIKTTNAFDIGSSTLGLRALYFGANSQTVNLKGSSSMSATWTVTLPVSAGTSGYLLSTNGSGVTSWTRDLIGTTTNDSAATGYVGEYLEKTRLFASSAALTSGSATDVQSGGALSLTAGDWDISGCIAYLPAATTSVTVFENAISATSNTLPATSAYGVPNSSGEIRLAWATPAAVPGNNVIAFAIPTYRVSLSATTSFYLVGRATFSVSTMLVNGAIWARRRR